MGRKIFKKGQGYRPPKDDTRWGRALGNKRNGPRGPAVAPTTAAAEPVLEICELTQHQYFGERALLEGAHKGKHSASVVSTTPVELLLLSKYDFYHHVDQPTQDLMKSYAEKFYFDEDKIRRSIQKQHRWDAYKQGLLQEVLSPRASPRATPRASPRAAGGKPRGGGE